VSGVRVSSIDSARAVTTVNGSRECSAQMRPRTQDVLGDERLLAQRRRDGISNIIHVGQVAHSTAFGIQAEDSHRFANEYCSRTRQRPLDSATNL
jgi:hypothetical protein